MVASKETEATYADLGISLDLKSSVGVGTYTINYLITNSGNTDSRPIKTIVTITYLENAHSVPGLSASIDPIADKSYGPGIINEEVNVVFNKYGLWKIEMEINDGESDINNHVSSTVFVPEPNHDINEQLIGQWHMWINYDASRPSLIEYWYFQVEYSEEYSLIITSPDWFSGYTIKTDVMDFTITSPSNTEWKFIGIYSPDTGKVLGSHNSYPTSSFVMSRPSG
jgi:hypothetical protein